MYPKEVVEFKTKENASDPCVIFCLQRRRKSYRKEEEVLPMVRTLTSCYRLNEIFAFLTYRLFTSKEKSECFKIWRHFANFRMLSETSSQQFNKTVEMIWCANPCAVRVPKLQLCFRPGTRRHWISSQNYVGVPNSSQLTQYLNILFFLSFYIS